MIFVKYRVDYVEICVIMIDLVIIDYIISALLNSVIVYCY